MKRLPRVQRIVLQQYIDCKRRTKKKIPFAKETDKNYGYTDDELMIHFMLDNSSIVEHESERSFQKVSNAVYVACKQLCPGQWCTRTHCEHYSGWCAYNCTKTRPAVCDVYKKYIEGVNKRREEKQNNQ